MNQPLPLNTFAALRLPLSTHMARTFTEQLESLYAAADTTSDRSYAEWLLRTASRWRRRYSTHLPN